MIAGPPAGTPQRPRDLLLDGFALVFTAGRPAAGPVLRDAASAFAGPDASVEEVLRWGWLATAAAVFVWDHDTCLAVSTRAAQLARDAGALEVLVVAVNVLAQAVALSGDFAAATFLVAEADAITEATGASVAPYGALVLGGAARPRGRGLEADRGDDPRRHPRRPGHRRPVRALGAGGADEQRVPLRRGARGGGHRERGHPRAVRLHVVVERAGRGGHPHRRHRPRGTRARPARGAHARAATPAGRSASGRARGRSSTRAQAADDLFREAIDQLPGGRACAPSWHASQLLHGEWLRREGRRVHAREQLRLAHEQLTALGMEGFAERARRELVATGGKARRRTTETRDDLTAQEEQIARLARDGLSNPEIGARLFLSPRTVEWHLKKVFTKLGISSRMGLHDALPTRGPRGRARLAPGHRTRAYPGATAGGWRAGSAHAHSHRDPIADPVERHVRQPAGEPRRSGDDPRAPGARRRARPRHRRDRGGLRQRRRRPLPRPVRHVARGRHARTPRGRRACRRGST